MKIVECVPNFSEGRRKEIVDEIVNSMTSIPGVKLLDVEMDPDHNRSVVTIAGPPESVLEAAFAGISKAVELIDLNQHKGQHPRIGAADVVPFVPLKDVTIEECVELAEKLAQRVADELKVPVYLYGEAAHRPERKDLPNIRSKKVQFEQLKELIKTDPNREPDYGPKELHPTAGATIIGVRKILIAYNVNLGTSDVKIAKKIARMVRARNGGLMGVRALGFELAERGITQVSMNLIDYEKTPIFAAYELVKLYADRFGVPVIGSEVVGLLPQKALVDVADFYLKLENFQPDQFIEARIEQSKLPAEDFLLELASTSPAPGGGSAAALSAAQGYALLSMVAGLTLKSKKYQENWETVKPVLNRARSGLLTALKMMIEDTEAFNRVMEAYRMPKNTDEEKAKRREAIQNALKGAAESPLNIMRHSLKGLDDVLILAEYGNKNAITDVGSAAYQFHAAFFGAELNVMINLSSIKDAEFRQKVDEEILELENEFKRKFDEATSLVSKEML